jgi:hypothetical protein
MSGEQRVNFSGGLLRLPGRERGPGTGVKSSEAKQRKQEPERFHGNGSSKNVGVKLRRRLR